MNYARRFPRFWLTYFVVLLILTAVGFGFAFVEAIGGKGSVQNAFGQVIGILSIFPLFGYVRQRRINPRWLWRVVFVIAGLGQIAVTGILLFMFFKTGSGKVLAGLLGLGALGTPLLIAHFQYIHRSPHIWAEPIFEGRER